MDDFQHFCPCFSTFLSNFNYLCNVEQLLIIISALLLICPFTGGGKEPIHPSHIGESMEGGHTLDMRQGLSESRVRQIKQMPDGRIAIATTATIDIFDGTRFTAYKLRPEDAYPLPEYHGHRQLTCDKNGMVWLRNERTLYVLDTRRKEIVQNVDSLIRKMRIKPSEIVSWHIDQAPDKYNNIENVTCAERDKYGGLWIGTKENGLIYINSNRERQFKTFPDSTFKFARLQNFYSPRTSQLSAKYAPSATNCTLDRTKGDYAWLGTRRGIMIFSNEDKPVATIDTRDGLSTDNIQCLIQDKHGDIWAATANGLSRIHIAGKDSFDIANYGELDGIHVGGSEFRTCQIHIDAQGLITAGYAGGIVIFNPDSIAGPFYVYHYPRPQTDITTTSAYWYWLTIAITVIIILIVLFYYRKKHHTTQHLKIKNPDLTRPDETTVSRLKAPAYEEDADKQFLSRLQETVEANISEEDFSVQALSEQMAMDRTGLYRRTQSLTGMSPSSYIRQIRMEVAARLLQETTLPVADIAIRTGYSTTKYFTRVFKEYYGIAPVDYRN